MNLLPISFPLPKDFHLIRHPLDLVLNVAVFPTTVRQRNPKSLLGHVNTIRALAKQIERVDRANREAHIVVVTRLPVDPRAALAADDALGLSAGAVYLERGGRRREFEVPAGGLDDVARKEERAGLLAALRALAGAGLSHTRRDELVYIR
jgi:hypothetical protein